MTPPPASPKIYHITHVDNLRAIMAEGALLSDAGMMARGGPERAVGMTGIKLRRVEKLEVTCHSGTKVGDYVPFYYCPRSIMLFVIHRANHPELIYRDGQEPIVHLEADLHAAIGWAEKTGVRWAFSLSNAGASYTEFRSRVTELDQLDWVAIEASDFRSAEVKERKQAEFLAHGRFPFDLFERIGVCSAAIQARATAALADTRCKVPIEVRREWYF
jgi:hypothetical protein